MAAIVGTAIIYLSSRGQAKSLNAGSVILTFSAPVNASILRAVFQDVMQIDNEGKVYRVTVPTNGEFNLPGLLSATPA